MVLPKLAKKIAERKRNMTDQKQPDVETRSSDARLEQLQAEPASKAEQSPPEYSGLADLDKAIQNRQLTGFLEERSMPLRYIWYFAAALIVIALSALLIFEMANS